MSSKDELFDRYEAEYDAALALHLGLTTDELEQIGVSHQDLQEDTGSSGEMVYSYYLMIPRDAPAHLMNKLRKNGFSPEHAIYIPQGFYDKEDQGE